MNSQQTSVLRLVGLLDKTLIVCSRQTILLQLASCDSCNISLVAIEVPGNFLHGHVSGLDDHVVEEDNFESQEADVEDVVAPLDVLHGDGVDELVEEDGGGGGDDGDGGTLGTETVGENLDGVGQRKTGPRKRIVSNLLSIKRWERTVLT